MKCSHQILYFLLLHHILVSLHCESDSSHSSSNDASDSSSDEPPPPSALNLNDCDCFSIKLTAIDPYPHIMCYVYDIQRKFTSIQCNSAIDDIVLSICNRNDIADLQYIYHSIVDFYPKYDDDHKQVSLSPYTDADITGLLISISVQQHTEFTLCLSNFMYTTDTAHKVRVQHTSNVAVCHHNDGLPCINPTQRPTHNPALLPSSISPFPFTTNCELDVMLDIVFLVDKSCGLNENECNIYHESIALLLYAIKNEHSIDNSLITYIEYGSELRDIDVMINFDDVEYQRSINKFVEFVTDTNCGASDGNTGEGRTDLLIGLIFAVKMLNAVVSRSQLNTEQKIIVFSNCENTISEYNVRNQNMHICDTIPELLYANNIEIVFINAAGGSGTNQIEDIYTYKQCLVPNIETHICVVDEFTHNGFIKAIDQCLPAICLTKTRSENPTQYPILMPSESPLIVPTIGPTKHPFLQPINAPTKLQSQNPSVNPTLNPHTHQPSPTPTMNPTNIPTIKRSDHPSMSPTHVLTTFPSYNPSMQPTVHPTTSPINPTAAPTDQSTATPTYTPTNNPTSNPTLHPITNSPSKTPSTSPTNFSSLPSTNTPSTTPSQKPTTISPITESPSTSPSKQPSISPSIAPTLLTDHPTLIPSPQPTPEPTPKPTEKPTIKRTVKPSKSPTMPTLHPTIEPTKSPTPNPTPQPTPKPTRQPTPNPTINPSISPTLTPTILTTSQYPTSSPSSFSTRCDALCDAFDIQITSIKPDVIDSTVTVYDYSIVRLNNDGICAGNMESFVLGTCTGNNVNIIFDNLLFYSPLFVGVNNDTIDVIISKLNDTMNPFGIMGIQVDVPIENNLLFQLGLKDINNDKFSTAVAFNRSVVDEYVCEGDGLPCLIIT